MARFFPVRSECQFDTFGKRRFADEKSERKGAIIIHTCPSNREDKPLLFLVPFS